MSSSLSLSAAATLPAEVPFSSASNSSGEVKEGAAFASVRPVPDGDHAPVPSSFVARTCTW